MFAIRRHHARCLLASALGIMVPLAFTGCASSPSAGPATTTTNPAATSSTVAPSTTTSLAAGSFTGWLTAATGGNSPSITLELAQHLTGQAATTYAQQHGMPNGAPNDHIDVDLKQMKTFAVSPSAQITLITAAQVSGAPTTQPPNVAAFVSWATNNLAQQFNGTFAGPLFQVTVSGNNMTVATQIFEP